MARNKTTSRFVARLREISQGNTTPLGFGRAVKSNLPAMLLLARLPKADPALAAAAADAGADGIIISLLAEPDSSFSSQTDAIKAVSDAAGGKFLGIWVGADGEISVDDLKAMPGLKIDFVIAQPHRAPADLLGIEDLGHVLHIANETAEKPPRGLNEPNVDAVEIALGRPEGSLPGLTVHDVAVYRSLMEGIRRPVLLPATGSLKTGDLEIIRDLGAEALVLTADILGEDAESLKSKVAEFRAAIDKLGPPLGRGRANEGRQVILPRVAASAPSEDDDDDDG